MLFYGVYIVNLHAILQDTYDFNINLPMEHRSFYSFGIKTISIYLLLCLIDLYISTHFSIKAYNFYTNRNVVKLNLLFYNLNSIY